MKSQDKYGLFIENACPEAAAGYDAYVCEFLSYGSKIRGLFPVADANPDCGLANAHAAALHLAFEGAEGWENAKPYLAAMRAAAPRSSERERLFIAAVEAWALKDFPKALAALDDLTVRWPADICALKWAQYHAFNLGDCDAMLRLAERARIVFENEPYAHGMIAFALEQNHRLGEAEEEGRRAVEIAIDDAWAHHAVAHVMETEGRAREGARWLDHCSHTWDSKGVFIRDHNWWHAGLFRLAMGRETEALEIFDKRLWGNWTEFPQEQIGAVSMLWRLEMRGLDVGDRWAPVVKEARRRAGEHILPFHDLHYLFALARAGEPGEAKRFFASLTAHAETAADGRRDFWQSTAIPAAEGVLDFAEGDFEAAAAAFARALPNLQGVGGSHAQRHLFIEAYEYAAAKARPGRAGKVIQLQ